MSLEPDIKTARRQVVEAARAMLDGTLPFIEGSRRIRALHRYVGLPKGDPDMLRFTAIDSETDALPFSEVRKLWQPEALAKLQPEVDRAEQWAREFGHAACQSLIERFFSQDE
jgi:hypothetical protein